MQFLTQLCVKNISFSLSTIVAERCAKVMIANFNEIRQNSRISRGNMGKFRCIYCSIVGKIARNEKN